MAGERLMRSIILLQDALNLVQYSLVYTSIVTLIVSSMLYQVSVCSISINMSMESVSVSSMSMYFISILRTGGDL